MGEHNISALRKISIRSLMVMALSVMIFACFGLYLQAYAAFNGQLNYQGKLTDSSGVAVANGTYNMEFKLYTVSSGGSAVWTETRSGANKVTVTNGLFSVMLGEINSISGVDFNRPLYLGINIGGTGTPGWDGEMVPRKTFGAVPAAFVAQTLDGLTTADFFRTSTTTTTSTASTFLSVKQLGSGATAEFLGSASNLILGAYNANGGTVGIGTSSPIATLSVKGTGGINPFTVASSSGNPLFTILQNGNVGIGTTTPADSLSVAGNFNLTGALEANGNAGTNGMVLQTTGSGISWVSTSSLGIAGGAGTNYLSLGNGFVFTSTSTDYFKSSYFVASSTTASSTFGGALGIGVASASTSERLQVAGNILIGAQADSLTDWTRQSSATAGIIAEDAGASSGISTSTVSAVYNGSLYVGTSKADSAEVYRYDGNGTWTQLNITGTAGKFNTTTGIDAVTSMTVYDGYLYIGTTEANSAEVYRYGGGTSWTQLNITNTAGKFLTTTAIDGVSAMAVHNGNLYIGTAEASSSQVYRYGGGTTWAVANATAGTFITQTAVDAVTSMVSFNRNLYIGTSKTGLAQVVRLDGSAVWVQLTSAAGTVGGTTAINAISAMTVYNGALYLGTAKANAAEVYRFEPTIIDGAVAANLVKVSNTTAGTMVAGGTTGIDRIMSLGVYNGNLYVGTSEPNAAEIYKYDTVNNLVKITNTTAGSISVSSPPTTAVSDISMLQTYNGRLYALTGKTSGAEMYEYQSTEGQSYSLKFSASSDNTGSGEQNGLLNVGTFTFFAEEQSRNNKGTESTGRFLLSHGLNTSFGAYDVAEDYPTRDESLQPGDLVSLDTNERGFVRRAQGRSDKDVIGIYSVNPALRLSQSDAFIDGARAVPVALAGRVPVSVTLENGPIKIGDYLTSSMEPGKAAKAIKPGRVIGRALGSYAGADGEVPSVSVFIGAESINWNDLQTVEVDVSQITDSQASAANGSGTVTDFVDTVNRSIEDIVFAVLNKVDNLSTVITNRLTAIVASIQELFVSSFTILPGGSITVPAGENQIAGVGHLAVGTTEVFVRNDMIDENAVVYLTSTSEIDSPLYVASKVVGKGFYVRIKKSQENDVSFNWFFIKTYRPKNVQGDSEITTTVSGGSDSSTTTMTVLAPDEDSVVSSGQPVSEVSTSSESVDPVSETSTNSESVDEVSENSISSEDQGAVQPPIETSVEPTQSAAESAAQTATE